MLFGIVPPVRRGLIAAVAMSLISTVLTALFFDQVWDVFISVILYFALFFSLYDCGMKLRIKASVACFVFLNIFDILGYIVLGSWLDMLPTVDHQHRITFYLIGIPFSAACLVLLALVKKYAVKPFVSFVNNHFRGIYISCIVIFITLVGVNLAIDALFYRYDRYGIVLPLILLVFSLMFLYYLYYQKSASEKKHT